MTPEPIVLTYAETADLLHISERSVQRLVQAGTLRPIYAAGKRSPRIHPDELRRFADDAYRAIVEAALAEPTCEEVPPGDGPLVRNLSGQIVRLASYQPAAASASRRKKKGRVS